MSDYGGPCRTGTNSSLHDLSTHIYVSKRHFHPHGSSSPQPRYDINHVGTATITISGPADVWFGVGLNAQKMSDSPYVIYANSSGAFEQQIGTCG